MIFTLSATQLTVFIKGRPYSIDSSHPNWDHMNKMVRGEISPAPDHEIIHLMNVRASVEKKLKDYGRIKVGDDQIIIDGIPTHNYSTRRILDMLREGLDITPWINFLDRCLNNPSKSIFDELYQWMEAGNLPVTPDGYFLAYKKVRDDLCSYHVSPDGTHLQHVLNQRITMPRYQVDDVRENTCSTGLHFCSWDYLKSYYGHEGKVLLLRIDPADVVSIPVDYNFTKGRACAYTPIKILDDEAVAHVFNGRGPLDGQYVYDDEDDDDVHPPRTVIKVRDDYIYDLTDITPGKLYIVQPNGEFIDDVGDPRDPYREWYEAVTPQYGDWIVALDEAQDVTPGNAYRVFGVGDTYVEIFDDVGDQNCYLGKWEYL